MKADRLVEPMLLTAICALLIACEKNVADTSESAASSAETTPARAPTAAVTSEEGVLFIEEGQVLPSDDQSSADYIAQQAAIFDKLFQGTEVRIVERTDRRIVAELDYAALGRMLAPRSNPNQPPCPSRWVTEIDPGPTADTCTLWSRLYYIGKDPDMAEMLARAFQQEQRSSAQRSAPAPAKP